MKKEFLSWLILFFLTILVAPLFGTVKAASLTFDPPSVSTPSAQTFNVNVDINAGTTEVNSATIYVLYDQNLLQVQSVSAGTYFPTVTPDYTTTPGKVVIIAMENDPSVVASGSGTIATIAFSGLTNGSGTLSFDCQQSSGNTSLITDINNNNVINCAQNGTSAITIGTGVSTASLSGTLAPSPSALPRTGFFDNVVKAAVPGAILLIVGGVARLLL